MATKKNCEINGNNYFRIRRKVGEDANGKSIIKAFYGEGKKEAEQKYQDYMQELLASPNKQRGDSLGKVAKFYTYEVMLNENLAPGTIELYERQYREKFAPSKLATRPAKDIASSDIQKYLNEVASGYLDGNKITVSQGSVKNLVKFLKKLFKYMKVEGYCEYLMENIAVPKVENANKKVPGELDQISTFTEDEIKRITNTPNRQHFLFVLALSTGLRAGELLALKYDDFKDGKVIVNKQLNSHYKIDSDGNRAHVRTIKEPKSSSSNRMVPLPKSVQEELKRQKAWHMEEMMEKGYRTEYVFTSEAGNVLDTSNLRRAWERHLKRAGVEYKKFHSCRSTYCTMLCKQGVPLETASKLMGHSDVNVTAEYYRFVSHDEMKTAANKIDFLFANEN